MYVPLQGISFYWFDIPHLMHTPSTSSAVVLIGGVTGFSDPYSFLSSFPLPW